MLHVPLCGLTRARVRVHLQLSYSAAVGGAVAVVSMNILAATIVVMAYLEDVRVPNPHVSCLPSLPR